MEKKLTIEELEAKYKELGAELEARRRAEKEAREAKLAAEKQARYDEIIAVYKHFEQLRSAYVDDYGYFTFETKSKNGDPFDFFWKHCGWC